MRPAPALATTALIVATLATPSGAGAQSTSSRPPPGHRQCFHARQANNFAALNDRTLNVRVGVRDVFQFQMFGSCTGISWNRDIALRSRSGWICDRMDVEVITRSPSGRGRQRCMVRNMRKLTPAEVEALPRRARP